MKEFKRILLKVSGEALMGDGREPFDGSFLSFLAREIASLPENGVQVGVVVGGGNIFRGLAGAQAGVDRVTGDYMGMLATLINCLALSDALGKEKCPSVVLSPFHVHQFCEPASAAAARRALDGGKVALFAGGTGNPFFTTDSGAVLRALESGAEAVFKATKVKGVYDRDPFKSPDARFLPHVTYDDALRWDLGVMDRAAFALCKENRLPILVFDIYTPSNILRAARGEKVGSLVDGEEG